MVTLVDSTQWTVLEIHPMSLIEAPRLLQMLLVNVKQAKSYKIPDKQQLSAALATLIACTARRIF